MRSVSLLELAGALPAMMTSAGSGATPGLRGWIILLRVCAARRCSSVISELFVSEFISLRSIAQYFID